MPDELLDIELDAIVQRCEEGFPMREDVRRLIAELLRARARILVMADGLAAQNELLSRLAERKGE